MKRLMLVWVIIRCLMPLCTWAVEDTTLYPIRENGLWGYMNQAGEVVIEPQWAMAWPFDRNTALVSTVAVNEGAYPVYGDGIIDRNGQYLVAPQEHVTIEDYSCAYCVCYNNGNTRDSYEGFYDKMSGFYQPPIPQYEFVMLWGDDGSGPIAIENADGLVGYVDRVTGEIAIPFIYTGDSDDVCFREGYAMPADEIIIEDADGHMLMMGPEYHLIDIQGREISFDDGRRPQTSVVDGVWVYSMPLPDDIIGSENKEYAEEDEDAYLANGEKITTPYYRVDPFTGEREILEDWETFFEEDDTLVGYGIASPDGNYISLPDATLWKIWEPDSCGMLCIVADDNKHHLGHMDLHGNVIVEPKYDMDWGGAETYYSFYHGYAVINDLGDNWPDTDRWVILDTAGNEVFTKASKAEDGTGFRICGDVVLENDLFWCEDSNGYSLIKLTGNGSVKVSDTVFEAALGCSWSEFGEGIEFSEGVHPVKQSGLWGYIDEHAQWVIPPQYDSANNFRDGLALVEKDGKLMYIDRSGAVVWEEE